MKRRALVFLLVPAAGAFGQAGLLMQDSGSTRIDNDALRQEMIGLAGMDKHTLGIDLLEQPATRIILADDPAIAARNMPEQDRPVLRGDSVPMIPAGSTYWVRFPITPSVDLKGVPLSLYVVARMPFELYLNGVAVLYAGQRPIGRTGPLAAVTEDFHPMAVQIQFACDGRPEVLAARVQSLPGDRPVYPPLRLALQSVRNGPNAPRLTMHYGICIGVNLIIALLAFITWSRDRRERSWSLLVLLALLTAFMVLCAVAGYLGVLGFSPLLSGVLHEILAPLFAWKMLLILLVLRDLRGDHIARFFRLWVGPALILTALDLVIVLVDRPGVDMSWTYIPMTILTLAIFLGLSVEVVRSAIRLMRTKGFERWFSIGALAFTMFSAFAALILEPLRVSPFSWPGLVTLYASYLSVPVSIAIYLALRSAKNNRLVARQRDELDVEVHERTAELRHEKERSDGLLRNILPEEVAEELKNTGTAQARHFDTVTILFTDFKGFTEASERMSPQELVAELNTCFKAFDGISTARGIEKIKTIGDAYMCAGGLPDPATSTPADVVHAALEMQAFMNQRRTERDALGGPSFEMRVGIHTGPVVAGIVGVKKFQYDIWGDTVNIASRMESSGEVEQVNISGSTYALVKDEPGLTFIPRGKVQAKGKGGMEMYFVQAGPAHPPDAWN